MIDATIQVKRGSVVGFLQQVPREFAFARKVREWKREPDSAEIFEISRAVNREGIIKYLGLDREGTIARLNRMYAGKKQGVSLLIRLLKGRYEGEAL
jgi:hypothetical protein